MLRPTVRLPAVSPLIPALETRAMIVAFRHRLPREASRRGGTGAGLRKDVSLCPVDRQKMVSLSSETGRGVPVRHTSGPATGLATSNSFRGAVDAGAIRHQSSVTLYRKKVPPSPQRNRSCPSTNTERGAGRRHIKLLSHRHFPAPRPSKHQANPRRIFRAWIKAVEAAPNSLAGESERAAPQPFSFARAA